MTIQEHLAANLIKHSFISENIFTIDGVGSFLVVREKDQVLDLDLRIVLDLDEEDVVVDYYVYKFGSNWYYSKYINISDFTLLKYLGNASLELDLPIPFLGIHGGFDLLNGNRSYEDWIKKAKFLGIDTLGVCEKNTLRGVLKFQIKCQKLGITPIIGMQCAVRFNDSISYVKCYVKNEIGWQNLLNLSNIINVDGEPEINRNQFLKLTDGLIIVLDPKTLPYSEILPYEMHIDKNGLFYQFESVEFENDSKDKDYLLNLKQYINGDIPPVLINDAYYLDEDDSHVKKILNSIADKREFASSNQYFKTVENIFTELSPLFNEDSLLMSIIETSIENLFIVVDACKYQIPLGKNLLPQYIMTVEEVEMYGDKESLFYALIERGLDKKCPVGQEEEYIARVELESQVIVEKGFVDYFLILWDIIKWSHENNILTGIGRGSAGGSLIAFLLNITELDPIRFNLLFERFLNKGRITQPDIDTDFEAFRREDVKKYMEHRYGNDRVCSIGTYTTLKLKQALKDISKLEGIDFETTNYISQILDIEDGKWFDIFKTSVEKKRVKDFVLQYPGIIEDIQLVLKQPKSKSVHACATLIMPDGYSIFNTIPTRMEVKDGESLLVSEWEGSELEAMGFLKEDILGIKQLDKYRFIIDSIQIDTGDKINIYDLPYDDTDVFSLFRDGYTGDIFHFGSRGLTKYCKQIKPNNIEDLIAAISLYRPGAMENNFHNEYVLRKNGDRDVEYWVGAEIILQSTYGIMVYQEHVMQLCMVLGGLNSLEADDVRRAMGKKDNAYLSKFKGRFIDNYVNEFGVDLEYATDVWDAIDKASGYLFNRSHAAAYAITGYIGQWLKVHYPLQYWSAALQFDDPNPKKSNMARYIGEIRKTSDRIKVKPPHINYSTDTFTSNFEKQELYWSLGKVRQLGEKGLPAILDERSKNGEFFDFKDFISRIDRRLINKAVVLNLILSGCFDDIEGVINPEDRIGVIKKFAEIDHTIDINEYPRDRFWWSLKQREVSGFGNIDYARVLRQETEFKVSELVGTLEVNDDSNDNKYVVVAGIINNFTVRISKKDNEYCDIELDCNNETVNVRIWSELYTQIKEELTVGKIFIMNGVIKFFREEGSVQSWEDSVIKIL